MMKVCVLFKDNAALVEPFFYFLRRSVVSESVMVYALDNGSTDETRERLQRPGMADFIVPLDENIGIAAGRNRLIFEADRNSGLFFLDSDVFVAKRGSLEAMVALANEQKGHAAIFGANHSFHDWSTNSNGICFSYFKEGFFGAVGKFDEQFRFYYDDTDIMHRATLERVRLVSCFDARAIHAWGTTLWEGSVKDETPVALREDNARYNKKWGTHLSIPGNR